MAISLQKGGNVNLSKEAPSMKTMAIGLGWNARVTDGAGFDLDACAFMLQESGKVASDAGFIFYNQKGSACGGVAHQGDNTTGEGDGDDEVIKVDLSRLSADVQKIAFAVTIHEADIRRQNFGMVSNAYIRIVDGGSNQEVARYDLSEDASIETAMIFGELYCNNGEWKFKAIGQGFQGGLQPLARNFGVNA